MALYFASQGAARLLWPLLAGFLRVIIAIGGGWLALRLTGSLNWLFAALAFGLVVYGVVLTTAIISGAWFGRDWTLGASPLLPRMRRKHAHVEIPLLWKI
jgi:hypothetical protein